MESEWIDANERKPAQWTPVIVSVNEPSGKSYSNVAVWHSDDWLDMERPDSDGEYDKLYCVTHWMPIPPPKIVNIFQHMVDYDNKVAAALAQAKIDGAITN